MESLHTVIHIFFGFLIASVFGFPFAMIPGGFLAMVLKASGENWMVPATPSLAESKVHYLWLSLFGGLAGVLAALVSLVAGEWWICYSERQLCYDGQGGLVLIATIPVLAFCGAFASLLWTWLTLRIAPTKLWASIFRYSGQYRYLNRAYSVLVPIFFWVFITYVVYRITLRS